jgi:hypothetical protein
MRLAAVLAVLALAVPATASARVPLTKRTARAEGLRFVAPFMDMLDVDRTVTARMVPPRECQRVSARTVTCRFTVYLEADARTVTGTLRVHRQRDGLLGFLLPWVT